MRNSFLLKKSAEVIGGLILLSSCQQPYYRAKWAASGDPVYPLVYSLKLEADREEVKKRQEIYELGPVKGPFKNFKEEESSVEDYRLFGEGRWNAPGDWYYKNHP